MMKFKSKNIMREFCVISLPPTIFNQNYERTIPAAAPITRNVFTPLNGFGSCIEITNSQTLTNNDNKKRYLSHNYKLKCYRKITFYILIIKSNK